MLQLSVPVLQDSHVLTNLQEMVIKSQYLKRQPKVAA
jgi:hypothetical protein